MPKPGLPGRDTVIASWVAQNSPSGPVFIAGVSDVALIEQLSEAKLGPLYACDDPPLPMDPELSKQFDLAAPLLDSMNFGNFCEWWRRAGGEDTFSAVIALGWPAKLNYAEPRNLGLPASVNWLLKPGGFFLCDWPAKLGPPIILGAALKHVGMIYRETIETATHPVIVWQKQSGNLTERAEQERRLQNAKDEIGEP